jgi:DNA polymerase III alpha subunit
MQPDEKLFVERGRELMGNLSLDKDALVEMMLQKSQEPGFGIVHPDAWVRDTKIDLSSDCSTNIATVEYVGDEDTYDIEVDHPDHQFFLSNGVLTSNSHAIAYAIDSYMCAWLLTHYPDQWLTSYLEAMSNNPDNKMKAFGEVRKLGYQIVPFDVNYALTSWTVLPGKKFMQSFLTCKSVGEVAAEEIIAGRPYASIEDMLWDKDGQWRLSKCNRKTLEALIKVEAFGSFDCIGEGKLFDNYHHMYEVIIEANELIKKTSKKDPCMGKSNFYELARRLRGTIDDWTRKEKAEFRVEYFGALDATTVADPDTIARLTEKDVMSIDKLESGEEDIVWFVTTASVMKKTRAGKPYAQATVVGPSGKTFQLKIWNSKTPLPDYSVYVAQVRKDDFGYSTVSFKLKHIG